VTHPTEFTDLPVSRLEQIVVIGQIIAHCEAMVPVCIEAEAMDDAAHVERRIVVMRAVLETLRSIV
jgi:hypothetical protein